MDYYTITREEALMGGYYFTLTSPKGKVITEEHGNSPIAPKHIRDVQARLNTKLALG